MTRQNQGLSESVSSQLDTWNRSNVLDLDDFSRSEVETVFEVTDTMQEVLSERTPRIPDLQSQTVVNLFYEPSTRTRTSFERAAKIMSADTINVSGSGSSVEKGESLIDTVRTLESMGTRVIVMRHRQAGAPYLASRHVQTSIINGGDGAHAHPTQALIDLYTIRNKLGAIEGLKVVIVGDILHSRVARSNIWGLVCMGAKVTLCAPLTLLHNDFLLAYKEVEGHLNVEPELDLALEDADVIMTLRLQEERQKQGLLPSIREYIKYYQINSERLRKAKPHALLLHPGPVMEGIEISTDVSRSTNSVIDEQVENGVAIRMALLHLVAGD
ncbi:MAG: aspartate carbamoyltransferase catalytic subunit [SAR202 cluster bacterium]|nr:aspartate carbamoyltransferase catalytic subunit [SAR202 cluster bacterium]